VDAIRQGDKMEKVTVAEKEKAFIG
jgi:hypothetical protein